MPSGNASPVTRPKSVKTPTAPESTRAMAENRKITTSRPMKSTPKTRGREPPCISMVRLRPGGGSNIVIAHSFSHGIVRKALAERKYLGENRSPHLPKKQCSCGCNVDLHNRAVPAQRTKGEVCRV